MQQVIQHRRVQDAGGGKLLARDGGADDGKNSRADDRADAECGEADGAERFLQRVLGQLALRDQLVNIFPGEYLRAQSRLLIAIGILVTAIVPARQTDASQLFEDLFDGNGAPLGDLRLDCMQRSYF
jgi:hypothetical protein